jgi:putative spermidine/putrescine transport system substrate-binding protein
MKKCLSVFLFLGLVGGLLFAGGSAEEKDVNYLRLSWDELVEQAKKEASLTFAHWRGESFWDDAATNFEEKYGIKVTIETSEPDGLASKMIGEKDEESGSVDVVLVEDSMVRSLMEARIFYGPIAERIPHGDKVDPKLLKIQAGVKTNGFLIPVYRSQIGLLYDPQKVTNPPQTWFELIEWVGANPPGQLAFSNPQQGSSGQAIIQAALANLSGGLDRYAGDSSVQASKTENWNEAWQVLKANRDMVSVTSSDDQAISMFSRGEAAIAVASDIETRKALQSGSLSSNAKLYVPKMGLPFSGDTLGVVKNAKNKAAAILFVAYLTETDVQKKMGDNTGISLARTDVQASQAVLKEEERKRYGVSWMPEAYRKRFTEEFVNDVLSP